MTDVSPLPKNREARSALIDAALADGGFDAKRRLFDAFIASEDLDIETALPLIVCLAEEGYAPSQAVLGISMADGRVELENSSTAIYWLEKAAEQGNAIACQRLAECYWFGENVEVDESRAVDLFLDAIRGANSMASFYVGVAFANGRGVKKDLHRAEIFYKNAADAGVVEALLNLGILLLSNEYNGRDPDAGIEHLKQAAETGNASAQLRLGYCYEDGDSGVIDIAAAKYWYGQAAAQGDERGIKALNELDQEP